ncbi:MAG: hypothetical protein JNL70_11265 [Saprospiraceae bacterium]|nr:hypothetical protein [Saprospiraceae bacterium]
MKKPSLEDKLLAAQIEKAHQTLLTPTPSVQIVQKTIVEEPKEKNVRVTVDMPESLHESLKYRIIKEKKSIREFIILLIQKELEQGGQ